MRPTLRLTCTTGVLQNSPIFTPGVRCEPSEPYGTLLNRHHIRLAAGTERLDGFPQFFQQGMGQRIAAARIIQCKRRDPLPFMNAHRTQIHRIRDVVKIKTFPSEGNPSYKCEISCSKHRGQPAIGAKKTLAPTHLSPCAQTVDQTASLLK